MSTDRGLPHILMNRLWNSVARLLILLMALTVSTVYAQGDSLPPLTNIVSDESGSLILFYPSGWILENDATNRILLSQEGLATENGSAQITLLAEVLETELLPIDRLADWLIEDQPIC